MYRVYLARHFVRLLKPYIKKFRHLEDDLLNVLGNFNASHAQYLGQQLYKIRIKSRDVPKGKNKSFRVIIYVLKTNKLLTPIVIYFKSDQEDISKKDIKYHLEMIVAEVERFKIK